MMNRVATQSGPRSMLLAIQNANRGLLDAQLQATSGKRINKLSDNPTDAVAALNHRAGLRRMEQFSRNAEEARSWLDAGDAALTDVSTRLSGVRTLLVQANSAANDSTSRAALADQIRSMRESIVMAANASKGGRPLFAGNAAGNVAYDATGSYLGDAGTVDVPITSGITMQVNATGPDVFGTPAADPTQGDVFQLLDSLASAVSTGDTTKISAGIAQIDTAMRRVATAQVQLGSRAGQLEDLTNTIEDSKVALKSSISQVENVDLAEAIINLKTREAAYQASLQATAKILQPSLLDFLR